MRALATWFEWPTPYPKRRLAPAAPWNDDLVLAVALAVALLAWATQGAPGTRETTPDGLWGTG